MKLEDVEDEVKFRLGDWFGKKYYIDRSMSKLAALPDVANNLALFSAQEQLVSRLNGFDQRIVRVRDQWCAREEETLPSSLRNASVINYLTQLGCKADFLVNMIDAHEFNYADVLGHTFDAPIITYTRRANAMNSVLMPAVNYHNVNAPNYPLSLIDPFDWASKNNGLVWRGRFTGLAHDRVPASQFERLVLETQDDGLYSRFAEFHRFLIVQAAEDIPGADVLFSCPPDFIGRVPPEFTWLYGPEMSPSDQCASKFILCLEGNDIGSSLGWTLASNSVCLMPLPTWDAVWTYALEPWRHFIPIARDGSDLGEKYSWCLEHPVECQEIAIESKRFSQSMFDPARKRLVDYLTMTHLEKSFLDFGSLSEDDFPVWGRWIQGRKPI